MLHAIGRAVLADGGELGFILLCCHQVNMDVVLTCFNSKVFNSSLLILVINHQLQLDYVQHHIKEDYTACYTPINNFISIYKLLIVGLKRGVAGSFHGYFKDELDGPAELTTLYLVLVDKAEVPRYIWVDILDICAGVYWKGGKFVTHEPS